MREIEFCEMKFFAMSDDNRLAVLRRLLGELEMAEKTVEVLKNSIDDLANTGNVAMAEWTENAPHEVAAIFDGLKATILAALREVEKRLAR